MSEEDVEETEEWTRGHARWLLCFIQERPLPLVGTFKNKPSTFHAVCRLTMYNSTVYLPRKRNVDIKPCFSIKIPTISRLSPTVAYISYRLTKLER